MLLQVGEDAPRAPPFTARTGTFARVAPGHSARVGATLSEPMVRETNAEDPRVMPDGAAAKQEESGAGTPLERVFWLDGVSLPPSSAEPLPSKADVLVVGSGYTGLSAASETAAAGCATVVLDAGPIGGGCSSRNGGQVAFSFKPSLDELTARHGRSVAERLYAEGYESIAQLRESASDGTLDCDWREVGSFCGAHSRRHLEALERKADALPEQLRKRVSIVPRDHLDEEIASPLYHGGLVVHDDAAVNPARIVVSLDARARAAGARVYGNTAVRAIDRVGREFDVATTRGRILARRVLIATNGYTGRFSPWHRRRVLPIGSYIIATEELDPAIVRRLIPRGRNVGDTRRVVTYVRPSPDGRRILFGGRASAGERDVVRLVPRMRQMMTQMFPDLARVRITHAWMGFVAYTFDTMPHLGEQDGLFHCLGYCGQGVPHAIYYGRKAGLRMLGAPGGDSALIGLAFPSRPYYTGWPWFLPATVAFYRLRDRLAI